jgi:hypothetical protein
MGKVSEAMIVIEMTVPRRRAQALSGLAPLGFPRKVGNRSRRGCLETGRREAKGARCADPVENGCGAGCFGSSTSRVGDCSFASLRNPSEPRAQMGQHTSEALRSSGKSLLNRQRTER